MKVIIERGDDGGFSVYTEEVKGAFGYGLTEAEAKEDFVSVLNEQAEFYKSRKGEYPLWYNSNGYKFDYRYDISGFFKAFPFINATKFAKEIGVNQSVMRKYKSKIVPVSAKQREKIQAKYASIVERMQSVKF